MIPISKPCLGKEELALVTEAIQSGWISSQGKFVKEFEQKFAEYIGTQYAVATSSGTTALHLALAALGIEKGDKVIVPTLTFIATANVVKYCNATPIFADIHPETWCINPAYIERLLGEDGNGIKAIIPVHLYGHAAPMDKIMELALKYHLFVIEDCAEALGAKFNGVRVGNFSHISAFSLFANKICATGEGGMCCTNSKELAEIMLTLRDHGQAKDKHYWYNLIGFNYRMTNLSAAIGLAQLDKIDKFLMERQRIRRLYEALLPAEVKRMPWQSWCDPINWVYTILLPKEVNRDKMIEDLKQDGIETRPMFYPLTDMPPYQNGKRYYIAEELAYQGLSLPTYPDLNEEDIRYICHSLESRM